MPTHVRYRDDYRAMNEFDDVFIVSGRNSSNDRNPTEFGPQPLAGTTGLESATSCVTGRTVSLLRELSRFVLIYRDIALVAANA